MELLFRFLLLITGIINFLPSVLVFSSHKLKASYGINFQDKNLELLLRHRAVMLGLIGGLMIFSAVTKSIYDVSTFMGLISMLSFVFLFYTNKAEINSELTKVFKIDIFASVVLLIGYIFLKANFNFI